MIPVNETMENLRVAYQGHPLDINDCDPDPEKQFDLWFEHALKAHVDGPNAFVLSTVTKDLKPRARVVLLKGIHRGEFVFYTNYDSSKGLEIIENQQVSLTFLWLPLARQIRIEGTIRKVSEKMSDEYFQKRPRGSQIGAAASPQSRPVSSRAELEQLFKAAEEKFKGEIPRPKNWGGYGITPTYFEFWQGRNNRMHDRITYEKTQKGWARTRLAP